MWGGINLGWGIFKKLVYICDEPTNIYYMLLSVKRDTSIANSNKGVDYKSLFPKLSKLSDDKIKVLLLMYDLESPFAGVPMVLRGERIAKFLAIDIIVVEGLVKEIESAKKNLTKECLREITSKQFDTVLYIYQSLNNQLFTLSRQIDSIKIDIKSEDDKTFDRFVKFAADSKKIVENIMYIKEQCRDEDEIIMLEYATGGGNDATKSFIDKIYSADTI